MSVKKYAAKVTIGGAIESSFRNAFGSANDAIKKLGAEVKALARQRADIKAFGDSSAKIDKFKESLNQANTELAQARAALASAEKPTAKLTRAVDAAERKVKSLETSLQNEAATLARLKGKLDQAGIGTANLERADAKLEARLKRITTAMRNQERASERLSNARGKLGSWMGAGVAVGAAAAAFVPAIKIAGDFETKLFEVARTGNLAADQIQKIRDGVDAAANRDVTNRSQYQLLEVIGQLVAQGADADTAVKSITSIGRASVATGTSMEDLTKTLFQMQTQLGITVEQSEKAFGILATSGKKGSFEIKDMAQYFPTLASTAANIGIKGESGIATLGAALQVARTGAGDASTAANNVLNLLSKLTAPATVKRMKKFGVDWEAVMKKAKEDGADPFIVALDQIQKVTGGDSFKIGEIFEDMQVKAALIPLLRSRKLFDEIRKASLESGKTIEEDFNKSLNSWPEILNSANNSFSKLGKTIGDQLIPSVGKLTVAFAKTVDRVSKWAKENPKLFRSIVIGTAAVVGLTAAVVAVGIAFAAVSFAVAGFTAAWAALGVVAAAAAVPVGAVIGIIAGAGLVIAGAALLIRKFWEPIATFFEGLWTGIKSGWESAGGPALWHEVTTAVGTAATKIKEWLKPVTGEFENVFAIGKVVGEFIGVKLVQLLGAILNPIDTVKQYLTGLKDEFVTAFNTIKNAAEPVLNWLAEKLQWITEKIGSAVDALKGIGNSLPQWMGGGGGEPAALPNKTSFVPPAMRGEGARQINVNVNGAPGQNEEALAAAVIRRIKQEQDMLGRGNLNDAAFA